MSKHFKLQKNYIESVERVVGFDHERNKPDSVQYVPILSSIKTLLQHENVLGCIYCDQNLQTGTINKYTQDSICQKNEPFSNFLSLQLILYHDDFGVSNPLRNKIKKYKTSVFHFVLGNIPSKHQSCLKDIQLVLLFPSELTGKYRWVIISAINGEHKNTGNNR